MKRMVLALALLAGGCGKKMTMGEACDRMMGAVCQRAVDCYQVNYDQCFQATKKACCIDQGTCELEVKDNDPDAILDACVPAIAQEDCSYVKNGVVPSQCLMTR